MLRVDGEHAVGVAEAVGYGEDGGEGVGFVEQLVRFGVEIEDPLPCVQEEFDQCCVFVL